MLLSSVVELTALRLNQVEGVQREHFHLWSRLPVVLCLVVLGKLTTGHCIVSSRE